MTLPSRILFAALQATPVKRAELVRFLISKEANVHALNPDGDALLHITMRSLDRSVCLEIAEVLIDVGCNFLARNLRGEAPLHIAAKQGHHDAVNYLILFSSPSEVPYLLSPDPQHKNRRCVHSSATWVVYTSCQKRKLGCFKKSDIL
ncbi:hypothetical protein J3R83DRAFT_31 [Lanmaoa asiatica]|nr:hypothetical protein J3R83DRAFT_31 [Lanmaoa asiatica]